MTSDQAPAAIPAKFLPLEALANAMHEVKASSDRTEALVQMVIAIDEVQARCNVLRWRLPQLDLHIDWKLRHPRLPRLSAGSHTYTQVDLTMQSQHF